MQEKDPTARLGIPIALGAHRHYAGDGWDWRSAADPDRGTGRDQSGGWVDRLLHHIEVNEISGIGSGGQPDAITSEQKLGMAEATQYHLSWFNCPTRRQLRLVDLTSEWSYVNMDIGGQTATISYDANWGDGTVDYVSSGFDPPLRDIPPPTTISRDLDRWGSAHPATWNVARCDGRVRSRPYDIDLETHADSRIVRMDSRWAVGL